MPTSLPESIKYATLNQRHPEYQEERIRKLQLLYLGGDELADNAVMFIPKEELETQIAYQSRLKSASYRNYFAQIINDYVSCLFSKPFSVVPAADSSDDTTPGDDIQGQAGEFYREFSADADLSGNALSELMRLLKIEAQTCGRAYLGVDFPAPQDAENIPESLSDEEASGAGRAYVYEIPTLSVIDWECDQRGNYNYLILRRDIVKRDNVLGSRTKRTIQFKVWTKQPTGVEWYTYEIETKLGKEPKPDDDCKLVDSDTVSFPEIPILCLHLPHCLWIGGLIANPVIDNYCKRSALWFGEKRSVFALPVYKQGPELPANGSLNEKQADPNRGASTMLQMKMKGFAVIGSDDEIEFKEPTGAAFKLIDDQLKDDVDAIFQVVNQMSNTVSANSTALARSGLSKAADHRSKEIVLSAYAGLMKKFLIKLYTLIAEGRGEDLKWQTLGMDNYKMVDRADILNEARSISLINIPSPTWKKLYLQKVAFSLTDDVSPETQQTIKDEIDKAITAVGTEILYPTPEPEPDQNQKKGPPTKQQFAKKKSE